MYSVTRNQKYDFAGESYSSTYPNLHKYPATMLPKIGIELFKELGIKGGKLLDPYCGSGSSFIAGLDRGLSEMHGFDINPLAILICKAKFTKIDLDLTKILRQELRNSVYEFVKKEENINSIRTPIFFNINYWFSKEISLNLAILKQFIDQFQNEDIKRLFLLAFSETVRECSYTRNEEFKLYRMKPENILKFNPDVFGVYFQKLNRVINDYEEYYYPKLDGASIELDYKKFQKKDNYYDVVLTSPPYGDSKTTVAYGQFSMFSNEWLGIRHARRIDGMLMGGKTVRYNYKKGAIKDYIDTIDKESKKRALEVSSYYIDLDDSIKEVATSLRKGGIVIYVVGNRTVKGIQLPTDQFIAEKFEENDFKHLFTYERLLGNKSMPLQNSPTNVAGAKRNTMTQEFIVVCEKMQGGQN